MSKAYINKIKVYQNQNIRKDTKKLFIDETETIFLTDSYSIIKLFDTEYNRKNKQDLVASIEKNNDSLTTQIIKMYDNFINKDFNIPIKKQEIKQDELTKKDYCYVNDNKNVSFNYKMLNRIIKIISTDKKVSYYTSEQEKNAICIVGKNGIAFLLGAITK